MTVLAWPMREILEQSLDAMQWGKDSLGADMLLDPEGLLSWDAAHMLLGRTAELEVPSPGPEQPGMPRSARDDLHLAIVERLLGRDGSSFERSGLAKAEIELETTHPDDYSLGRAANTALALAVLSPDAERIQKFRKTRLACAPLKSAPEIELLYASSGGTRTLAGPAACAAAEAIAGLNDFIAPALAGLLRHDPQAAATLLVTRTQADDDLFPDGELEPARVEVSDPTWQMTKDSLTFALTIEGPPPPLVEPAPALEPLLQLAEHAEALCSQSLPISKIKGARTRKRLDGFLANPDALLRIHIETRGGVNLPADTPANYQPRVATVLEWMRTRYDEFRIETAEVVCGA